MTDDNLSEYGKLIAHRKLLSEARDRSTDEGERDRLLMTMQVIDLANKHPSHMAQLADNVAELARFMRGGALQITGDPLVWTEERHAERLAKLEAQAAATKPTT